MDTFVSFGRVIGEALAPRDNLTSGPISGFPFGRASPGDRASGAYKMPVKPKEITKEALEKAKRLLDYDPETGILSWKPNNESSGRGRPKAGGPVRSVNQHGYCTSKSGLIGASWCAVMCRWRACIRIQGRQTVLSYHDTPEAAHQAYLEAKRRLHPGCTI